MMGLQRTLAKWSRGGTLAAFMLLAAVALAACGEDEVVPVATTAATVEKIVEATTVATTAATVEKIVEATTVPSTGPGGTLIVLSTTIGAPNYSLAVVPKPFDLMPHRLGIYESVIEFDGKELRPMIAKSWSLSDEGVTFKLNSGVRFHDDWGVLDADDVVATYDDGLVEGSTWSASEKWKAAFSDIEALDDETVFMKFAGGPAVNWAHVQMNWEFAAWNSPKRIFDEKDQAWRVQNAVGTGPFRMAEHVADDFIRLEAVPNHWRKTAGFDIVLIQDVPEESTRIALLRTGAADIARISLVSIDQVEDDFDLYLGRAGGNYATVIPTGQFYEKTMEDGTPLDFSEGRREVHSDLPWVGDFDDPASMEAARKVRWAMAMAIDREAIVDTLLAGQGNQNHTIYYGDNHSQYDADRWFIPFDPEMAKQYLADAGYPDGFTFEFYILSDFGQEYIDVGEALIPMWENVGLKVDVTKAGFVPLLDLLSGRTLNDLLWIGPYGSGAIILEGAIADIENQSHLSIYASFEYERATKTFRESTKVLDRDKAWDVVNDHIDWVQDEMLGIPVVSWRTIWVAGPKVGDWDMFYNFTEWPSQLESITPAR